MNIYIDLGAHKGVLLSQMIKHFKDIDMFIAFEPVPSLCRRMEKRIGNNPKVKIFNKAASCFDGQAVFYVDIKKKKDCGVGNGSTLIRGIYNKEIIIESVDFSKYLNENFKLTDNIVLKLDIEGHEYELLNHMIDTGSIKYINRIYCEWHKARLINYIGDINGVIKVHDDLISDLKKNGFDLQGKNNTDELSKIKKIVFAKERLF